ncbi:MAG: Hpt domain-containing protein [Bauldia sp.]|nr:Hpt domain-containing protein [Bauldia sp.]
MALRDAATPAPARKLDRSRRPAIDLDHLDRQTLGDHALRTEVLRLFLQQCDKQVVRLKQAEDPGERREAAHALVGSARGIGAFSVAYIASEIELARGPVTGRLEALEAAAAAARDFIADFLAD